MKSPPRDWKIEIEHLPGTVRIILWPVRKAGRSIASGMTLLFLLAFSAMSGAVGWKILSRVLQTGSMDAVVIFFLLLFSCGFFVTLLESIVSAYLFAWQLAGHEILEINGTLLKSKKKAFALSWTRVYTTEEIVGIDLAEEVSSTGSVFRRFSWMVSGRLLGQIIVAGQGGKREYVGYGIDHERAEGLLEIIREHLYPMNAD